MKLTSTEHKIIHTASAAAATTAASPLPFSDAALLIPIQATMITSLYKANGANISQGFVKGVLKATMISTFGKSLAGNLLKFIPVVGTLAGGTINAGVAVGFTEALGFAVVGELRGTDNADLIDLANVTKDVLEGFTKK